MSGQRRQTLQLLDIRNMRLNKFSVKFTVGDLFKQSRTGSHFGEINIVGYPPDRRLCVLTVLTEYINRTKIFRCDTHALFITTQEPYNAASADTFSRWIKDTLKSAGINMDLFTPHSTIAAAVSAAANAKIPIDTILKTEGWSNSKTFANYYKKPVLNREQFSKYILDKVGKVPNSTTQCSTDSSD